MEKKLSRISAFVENLPVVSTPGEIQSTVLSNGLDLLGAGANWTNGENCENRDKETCSTSTNQGNCKNYKGFCSQSTNGGSCANYPSDEEVDKPVNVKC